MREKVREVRPIIVVGIEKIMYQLFAIVTLTQV